MATSLLHGLIGGVLIGCAAILMMFSIGRIAGISGIASHALFSRPRLSQAWRWAFIIGLLISPLIVVSLGLPGNVAFSSEVVLGDPLVPWPVMAIAGLCIGLGTGWSHGCTSGHGVCGLARLSPRSLVATMTFVATAMLTVGLTHSLRV